MSTRNLRPIQPSGEDEFLLHLQAWVIQDGNYPDLRVGDRLRYGVAFERADPPIPEGLPATFDQGLSRRGTQYWGRGKIIFAKSRTVTVVDFGKLLAFTTLADLLGQPGETVEGDIRLVPDHYEFRELFAGIGGIPDIESDWLVTGLWCSAEAGEEPTHALDGVLYRALSSTSALLDHGGLAEYLVMSRRLP